MENYKNNKKNQRDFYHRRSVIVFANEPWGMLNRSIDGLGDGEPTSPSTTASSTLATTMTLSPSTAALEDVRPAVFLQDKDATEDNNNNHSSNNDEADAPRPTANGGFTHTKTSKAKISAANKGKTPWNKGQPRSEAVKARIAAGVKARNRQRFLAQLQQQGITEEEYNAKQEALRIEKQEKQEARRTAAGGYRPTEETKRKISRVLKEKYAEAAASGDGLVAARKRRPPQTVRRGFTHSEETRRKISESLRQRWAVDAEYRAKMIQSSQTVKTLESVRQKISASLRAKWQDPVFRAEMMENMARKRALASNNNNENNYIYHKSSEARQKISEAIKAKWQDAEYREKIRLGMLNKRNATSTNSTTVTSRKPTAPARTVSSRTKKNIVAVQPRVVARAVPLSSRVGGDGTVRLAQPRVVEPAHRPGTTSTATATTPLKKRPTPAKPITSSRSDNSDNKSAVPSEQVPRPLSLNIGDDLDSRDTDRMNDSVVDFATSSIPKSPTTRRITKNDKKTSSINGNVDLLKEERRDLYDLLYGDETEEPLTKGDSNLDVNGSTDSLEYLPSVRRGDGIKNSKLASVFALEEDDDEDDNLDNFDPYGLDDF